MFTPCQLRPCLKSLYGHLQSQHLHLLSRDKHRLEPKVNPVKSFSLQKRAYTHKVTHTSPQNILSLFKFTKKKRKKYNRINTFLVHTIVRSQYQQGPLGATSMQSNKKAETRMNALTPHPVYNWPNLPEKIGNDTWRIQFFKPLRPVYTKSSNYCDNVNCSNSIRIGKSIPQL